MQTVQRETTIYKEQDMSDPAAATEASKMSDLLAAASLLLTVLGVVYGTWYSEIITILDRPIDVHPQNRGPIRQAVRSVLYSKASTIGPC